MSRLVGQACISLIGPGGAGKSTVAPLLAKRIGCSYHDLDACFTAWHGDIDIYIATRGYAAYARGNVDCYLHLLRSPATGIMALSSGFMTYPSATHPACGVAQDALARHPRTFVLLPSLDLEVCVAETIRRQTTRESGRTTAERAEAKIRARFPRYLHLGAPIVTTMRPPAEIADELTTRLAGPGETATDDERQPDRDHSGAGSDW